MVVVVVVGGQWAISETRRRTSTYAGREWLAGAAKPVATCPAWQLPACLCTCHTATEGQTETRKVHPDASQFGVRITSFVTKTLYLSLPPPVHHPAPVPSHVTKPTCTTRVRPQASTTHWTAYRFGEAGSVITAASLPTTSY